MAYASPALTRAAPACFVTACVVVLQHVAAKFLLGLV